MGNTYQIAVNDEALFHAAAKYGIQSKPLADIDDLIVVTSDDGRGIGLFDMLTNVFEALCEEECND